MLILSGVPLTVLPELLLPSADDSATVFEVEETRVEADEALTLGRSQSIKNIFILHCTTRR